MKKTPTRRKAKTNQERSQERREALTTLARELGFPSWRVMETELKNARFQEGRHIKIIVCAIPGYRGHIYSTDPKEKR